MIQAVVFIKGAKMESPIPTSKDQGNYISIQSRANEVMEIESKPTTMALLNQHNPQQQFKCLSLYPLIRMVFTSHEENFYLQNYRKP